MYFLKQITQQFSNFFCHYFEQGPGNPGFDAQRLSEESAQREAEAARPETERLAEVDTLATESTAEMRTRMEGMRAEQGRIARAEAAIAVAEGNGNPDTVVDLVPPSRSERILAEQAIIAAGGDVSDEAAINAAIVAQRGDTPGEAREISPEEEQVVTEAIMAEVAAEMGVDPELLMRFSGSMDAYNRPETPEERAARETLLEMVQMGPDGGLRDIGEVNLEGIQSIAPTFEQGMENLEMSMRSLAKDLDRLEIVLERSGGEMPEDPEAILTMLEEMRDQNGEIPIELTQQEAEELGFVFHEDGSVNFESSPTYAASGGDVSRGRPYIGSNGNVMSGYSGPSSRPRGANAMDINLENLTPGVDGLVEMIYQAEANGDPDMIYGGCRINPPRPITQMTVREVRQFQDQMVQSGSRSSAVGACQVIRGTMDGAINSGLLDPNETFNVEAQMRFTIGKLNERGLQRFIGGQIDEMTFMRNVSMEWASFPRDLGGASYYAGDGLNHALVNPQQVLAQLRTIRESATQSPTAMS